MIPTSQCMSYDCRMFAYTFHFNPYSVLFTFSFGQISLPLCVSVLSTWHSQPDFGQMDLYARTF